MKIEYDPTRKKYLLDARITTKAKALAALRSKGLTCRKANMLLELANLLPRSTVTLRNLSLSRRHIRAMPPPARSHAHQRSRQGTQFPTGRAMGPREPQAGHNSPKRLAA